MRYQHERKGVITPDKFLPEIEKAGLIRYIDLFVLEESCRLMRQWLDEGWEGFPVSLNYSRITILEPGDIRRNLRYYRPLSYSAQAYFH